MEGAMKRYLTDFAYGIIVGFLTAVIIFGLLYVRHKNKEMMKNAKLQIELQELREDYNNRDVIEFFHDFPGVRRAADGAAAEFERKRDEALFRFRNRLAD
jgi:H+/gluconate symporter-like permease